MVTGVKPRGVPVTPRQSPFPAEHGPTVGDVDLGNVQYTLSVLNPTDATETNISAFLTSLRWAEHPGELAMRLDAEFKDGKTESGASVYELLPNGGKVILYASWGEGFKPMMLATIFHTTRVVDGVVKIRITAYDDLIFLQKSVQTYWFTDYGPANAILRRILLDWMQQDLPANEKFSNFWITIGSLASPTTIIWQRAYRGMTLAEIILQVLTWAFARGQSDLRRDQWFLRLDNGVIDTHQPADNDPVYHIHADSGITSFTDEQHIEDLVTEIGILPSQNFPNLVSGVGNLQDDAEAGDFRLKSTFYTPYENLLKVGRIRIEIEAGEGDIASKVVDYVKDVFDIRSQPWRIRTLQCVDLPFLRRGHALRVTVDSMGNAPVLKAEPAGDYGTYAAQPEAFSDEYIVTGIEHDAVTRMMNVTFDSTGILGRRLVKQSFEAPLRGQEDDEYEILRRDQLNNSLQVGKNLYDIGETGRVQGGDMFNTDPLGSIEHDAVIWNTDILAAIQPWMGTQYLMGGNGPPKTGRVDCSGFTKAVMTSLGKNFPWRTAQTQYDNTDRINYSDLQPGDLLFFQGTYSTRDHITHVGIYIGDNRMISAVGDTGVSEQDIRTPYWVEHSAGLGRVR